MTSGPACTKTKSNNTQSLELEPILTRKTVKKTVEFRNVDRSDEDISFKAICGRENSITVIGDENPISTESGRLLQPRMSLLGRPLNYRASRRDARYRRLQSRLYNFLERPRGAAILYHLFVFIMVFAGLALSVFSTIDEYEKPAGDVLVYMESIVCVLFSAELILRYIESLRTKFELWMEHIYTDILYTVGCLRTWSSGCRSRYQGYLGRLKFLRRPFCIIDMCTIIASIVVLAMTMKSGGQVLAASALRGLRFFQILRMVRMDRRGGTWKLLGSVVYAHRQELITTMYIGFLGLIFASFLVFLAEKEVPNTKFNNFAQALWWGVITLCTVGYGDMVPVTWQGKIIASFCSLLGISFFALPAGILGSGFALKVQQQQRAKHMIRRRQPAAKLIQSAWRLYASDEKSTSVATWKIHQVAYSPPTRVATSFRHNASFVGRFSTIRRHRNPLNPLSSTAIQSPSLNVTKSSENVNQENLRSMRKRAGRTGSSGSNSVRNTLNANNTVEESTETRVTVESANEEEESVNDEPQPILLLTKQHKDAIRAIRWIKFFVARRKFREALKPYDVKDVIEQYSSGHADLMNRVKNLQCRLDQILGKQDSKSLDVYSSDVSLASRVVKVERQVDDVFSKIDQFLEIYMEDRKHFINPMAQQTYPGYETSPDFTKHRGGTISSTPSTNSYALKPKSILVDKTASEPNSPIAKSFVSPPPQVVPNVKKPVMQRGYSDVGSRVKKKVTLRDVDPDSSCTLSPVNDSIILTVPPNTTQPSVPSSQAVTSSVSSYTEISGSAPSVSGTLVSMSSSIEASSSAQNLSINMEMGYKRSRTVTESTDTENCVCCDSETNIQDVDQGDTYHITEETEEEEEETNETTLLCPPPSNEIIITPSTLNCTTKLEVVSENVYLMNFGKIPGKGNSLGNK